MPLNELIITTVHRRFSAGSIGVSLKLWEEWKSPYLRRYRAIWADRYSRRRVFSSFSSCMSGLSVENQQCLSLCREPSVKRKRRHSSLCITHSSCAHLRLQNEVYRVRLLADISSKSCAILTMASIYWTYFVRWYLPLLLDGYAPISCAACQELIPRMLIPYRILLCTGLSPSRTSVHNRTITYGVSRYKILHLIIYFMSDDFAIF